MAAARLGVKQQGAVQMRVKTSGAERSSQARSLILQESQLSPAPLSRHRRNQSQHVVGGASLSTEACSAQLNVARLSDGLQRQKKSWSSRWVVLSGRQLLLYRDRKQEVLSRLKPDSKVEAVELRGASIQWTTEKTSRKNVLQLRTVGGAEYLLQADSSSSACIWFDGLKGALNASSDSPLRRCSSSEFLSQRGGSLPGFGSAPSSNKPRPPGLQHSNSSSGSLRSLLVKLLTRRPSVRSLQARGIIRERRVFGCPLVALCERDGDLVPVFVRRCVAAVERGGLQADGIYRVSGNLATIQKLRLSVDREEDVDLDSSQWEDVHVLTGALKMFLRELPEPLIPARCCHLLVEAVRLRGPGQSAQTVKTLVEQLPPANLHTARLLFLHLQRVLEHSRENLMSAQGLAIVFGPTLMWAELEGGNMAVQAACHSQVVEFLLANATFIFS